MAEESFDAEMLYPFYAVDLVEQSDLLHDLQDSIIEFNEWAKWWNTSVGMNVSRLTQESVTQFAEFIVEFLTKEVQPLQTGLGHGPMWNALHELEQLLHRAEHVVAWVSQRWQERIAEASNEARRKSDAHPRAARSRTRSTDPELPPNLISESKRLEKLERNTRVGRRLTRPSIAPK